MEEVRLDTDTEQIHFWEGVGTQALHPKIAQ
jgi:hypothetical protein